MPAAQSPLLYALWAYLAPEHIFRLKTPHGSKLSEPDKFEAFERIVGECTFGEYLTLTDPADPTGMRGVAHMRAGHTVDFAMQLSVLALWSAEPPRAEEPSPPAPCAP